MPKGQGALEYLLLIGGAVLIAVIVISLLLGLSGSSGGETKEATNSLFDKIRDERNDAIGGGGSVASCNNNGVKESGEECDGSDLGSTTCTTLGFTGGSLSCNGDCTYNTSSCSGAPSGSCTGQFDYANATLCPGDSTDLTGDTAKTLVPSCSSPAGSAPKCQYICNGPTWVYVSATDSCSLCGNGTCDSSAGETTITCSADCTTSGY